MSESTKTFIARFPLSKTPSVIQNLFGFDRPFGYFMPPNEIEFSPKTDSYILSFTFGKMAFWDIHKGLEGHGFRVTDWQQRNMIATNEDLAIVGYENGGAYILEIEIRTQNAKK